jgi:hypothetical protein
MYEPSVRRTLSTRTQFSLEHYPTILRPMTSSQLLIQSGRNASSTKVPSAPARDSAGKSEQNTANGKAHERVACCASLSELG